MSANAPANDHVLEQLVDESRERQTHALARPERLATWLIGASFVGVTAPLAALAHSERTPSIVLIALTVLAYAVLSRIEFEVGSGSAVPTQLVLVPMLFVLPVAVVPLAVALGYQLALLPDVFAGRVHPERAVVALGNSWHSLGPAAVLLLAGEPGPALGDWPLYLAALAAQFALDLGSAAAREWLAVRVPPAALLRAMATVFAVDSLLAPVGLMAALASSRSQGAFLLVVPLAVLLGAFAKERQRRLDFALELSGAYRGTAFLLGDVVEADDAYTGSHSRQVVGLALAVADELGLEGRDRRDVEFTALLHDVGKIRIPGEIVNKPGPLTPDERALMETHTVEGEQLLVRVGGVLGEVGALVRSCHERVDGRGYPDGLAGAAIPLVSRIVCCCDAFNAMTTDRPYRKALPLDEALAELRRNAGTQFDADVVAALARAVERGDVAVVQPIASLPTKAALSEPERNGVDSISTAA
jgi:HD-GYP domain-containing protein (c-di-GMP phosphodiesterase class II)